MNVGVWRVRGAYPTLHAQGNPTYTEVLLAGSVRRRSPYAMSNA